MVWPWRPPGGRGRGIPLPLGRDRGDRVGWCPGACRGMLSCPGYGCRWRSVALRGGRRLCQRSDADARSRTGKGRHASGEATVLRVAEGAGGIGCGGCRGPCGNDAESRGAVVGRPLVPLLGGGAEPFFFLAHALMFVECREDVVATVCGRLPGPWAVGPCLAQDGGDGRGWDSLAWRTALRCGTAMGRTAPTSGRPRPCPERRIRAGRRTKPDGSGSVERAQPCQSSGGASRNRQAMTFAYPDRRPKTAPGIRGAVSLSAPPIWTIDAGKPGILGIAAGQDAFRHGRHACGDRRTPPGRWPAPPPTGRWTGKFPKLGL